MCSFAVNAFDFSFLHPSYSGIQAYRHANAPLCGAGYCFSSTTSRRPSRTLKAIRTSGTIAPRCFDSAKTYRTKQRRCFYAVMPCAFHAFMPFSQGVPRKPVRADVLHRLIAACRFSSLFYSSFLHTLFEAIMHCAAGGYYNSAFAEHYTESARVRLLDCDTTPKPQFR